MRAYLFPTLTADQIEVKVKKVTNGGALLLLYKTARTDYDILDEVLGPDGWKVEYGEIKGNLYCTLSIWSEARGEWISKQNCGTESREDGEGNEKKGEASDAMKRAGVTLGIGRELYTSPVIYVSVPTKPKGNGYELADRYQTFDVREIDYDDARRINKLVIVDNNGAVVFTFPRGAKTQPTTPPPAAPTTQQANQAPRTSAAKLSGMATPFQVKTIMETAPTDVIEAMKQTYGGVGFPKLTFARAKEAIDKLKGGK